MIKPPSVQGRKGAIWVLVNKVNMAVNEFAGGVYVRTLPKHDPYRKFVAQKLRMFRPKR